MNYELPHTDDTSYELTNRSGKKLFVVVKVVKGSNPTRLAFLAHGFNDVHDSRHMRAATGPLLRAGYRVVLWDATNSRGRSEGNPGQVSLTTYIHDCEDILAWAEQQPWYVVPFLIGGHSMGGATAGLVASRRPEQVEKLLLLAPLVSGWRVSKRVSPVFRMLHRYTAARRAARTQPSWYSWELMRDLRRYDLISVAYKLNFPTLIIVGSRDVLTTPADQRLLAQVLPQGELEIVLGATHNFAKDTSREIVAALVAKWLL